jgi:hypothetical protein
MAKEYLDKSGLTYFWGKLKDTFATKNHTHTEYYTKAEVDQMISDIQDILDDAILKSTAS